MRGRTWVERTLTTTIIGPVIAVLGVMVALTNAPYADPYWLDLSSKATGSLLLLAPGLAAVSAWDAARWRVLAVLPVRGWPQLLARHLAIVSAITAATFLVTLVAIAAQVPPSVGFPRMDVLLLGVWMVVAYSAVGFVLGRILSRMIAAPLAFAVVWFWVAYTPAVQPFWMRNVTGNLAASCCTLDRELVDQALLAPAVVGGALVLCAFLVSYRPKMPAIWALSSATVAVAVVVAAGWMSHTGADPVRWRTGAQECVDRSGTKWCAWPEHAGRLQVAAGDLGAAAAKLRAAGLRVPRRLGEDSQSTEDVWSYSLAATGSDTWVRSFATSPLVALPPACIEDDGGVWPAGKYESLAKAWLESVAGVPADQAAENHDIATAKVRQLLSRSADDQLAWYENARAAMSGCDNTS